MPAINIYSHDRIFDTAFVDWLKRLTIKLLSCDNLTLQVGHISVRPISVSETTYMIAPIECDIFAASFDDRIKRQDEICNGIRLYFLENISWIEDVRVWLSLSELWHSF